MKSRSFGKLKCSSGPDKFASHGACDALLESKERVYDGREGRREGEGKFKESRAQQGRERRGHTMTTNE